jgi:hypothetical protein
MADRLSVAVIGAVLLAVFGSEALGSLQINRATGATLSVTDDRIVIEHPGYLRRPVSIPRAAIPCAAIDEGPVKLDWTKPEERPRRFPILPVAGVEAPSHLYPWTNQSKVPLPSLAEVDPNLVVLFGAPLVIGPMRAGRWLRAGVPGRRRPAAGIFLRVTEPAAAVAALGVDVVRQLTARDLAALLGDQRRRQPRRGRRLTVAVIVVVVLAILAIVDPAGLLQDVVGQALDPVIRALLRIVVIVLVAVFALPVALARGRRRG